MNAQNIVGRIEEKINETYREYPVVVQESPEDSETLWVQVFAVPAPRVREVKNFIHDLQDGIGDESGVVLLPMVKNLEVTQKYYPQHAPVEIPAMIAAYGRFLEKQEASYKHVEACSTIPANALNGQYGIDYLPQQIFATSVDTFHHTSSHAKAADTELALAA